MKKFLYENVTLKTDENSEIIHLKYFLLEEKIQVESCEINCYGIEVKKTACVKGVNLSEIKHIPNVFLNRNTAISFLKKISQCHVTPIALSGILEDYMSDAIHSKTRLPLFI